MKYVLQACLMLIVLTELWQFGPQHFIIGIILTMIWLILVLLEVV